jgi:carbon-monoxide dehydrogenase iron sulfur subunit
MKSGLVKVHAERCVACKRCIQNCAIAHSKSKNLFDALTETPAPRPRVKLHMIRGAAVPTECRHCEAAACVLVCPTGAMYKTHQGGPVLVDDERCIGCRSCVLTCPWGVPEAYLEGEQITKCDLCIDRLRQDQIPACVEACPTQCLEFVDAEPEPDTQAFVAWRNLDWG